MRGWCARSSSHGWSACCARRAQRRYLRPQAVYGYFPVRVEGDDLIVLDPDEQEREIERFPFPRQPDGERLCLADYFVSADGNASGGRASRW